MKTLLSRSVLSCPHGHLQPHTVLGADDNMTETAYNTLASSGFHSMPVSAGGQIIGILDLADFSRLALRMFTGDKTVKLTVRECMNLSGNDRFVCLGKEASVLQALKALNRVHQHRICIARDPKDKSSVFGVLSQIDLVNYFLLHIEEFGPKMASMPLSELAGAKYLGYAGRVLVSVQSTDSVLFALQLMDRHEITGVPVLRKGKICGTISLADVPRALNHLLSPCMNFLDEGKGREGRALGHDVATVDEDCTFASLLKGFSASNLHRLWVMDGSDLKGVITLTDVMRCLLTLSKEKKKTKKNKEKK